MTPPSQTSETFMKIVLIYTASWIGLVFLAILNGAIREKTYGIWMEELSAHQLSTIIGLFFFGSYIWIITGVFRIETERQALMIGSLWVVMTIVFEFLFGHYVMGHSWDRLLYDYHLLKGRIWLLVLIWTLISPYLFYKVRY